MPGGSRWKIVGLTVLAEGGLAGGALLLGWLLGQRPWEYVGWDWQALGLGVLTSLPPLALFFVLYRWPVGPLEQLKYTTTHLVQDLFGRCTIWELAFIALLAGVGEEWLFRGVLQKLAESWLQPWVALLVVSVFFGLLHCITPTYGVLATGMGLYLGWLAMTIENLLPVMANHAFYDFVALVYLVKRPRSDAEHETIGPGRLAPPTTTGVD
jgi:membrane protease YdiL (CAAX protease family)